MVAVVTKPPNWPTGVQLSVGWKLERGNAEYGRALAATWSSSAHSAAAVIEPRSPVKPITKSPLVMSPSPSLYWPKYALAAAPS